MRKFALAMSVVAAPTVAADIRMGTKDQAKMPSVRFIDVFISNPFSNGRRSSRRSVAAML